MKATVPPMVEGAMLEQRQRHQRLRAAPLVDDEADRRDDAAGEQRQAEVERRAAQVHHAVEQGEDGDRDQAQADDVEPAARLADRLAAGRVDRQVALRHRRREKAERRDDEEDRAPAERLDEDAADARPERRREDDAEAEDAHRLAALTGAERVQDDDRRDRLQHAGGQPLGDARREDEDRTRG